MIWVLYLIGGLVGLILVLSIVGSFLSRSHVTRRTAELPVTPKDLWAIVTDFEHQEWRQGFLGVERKPDQDGKPVWLEKAGKYNEIVLRTDEEVPPTRLVRTIADPKSPFTGSWTYELAPTETGTRLTITEQGEVKPPLFRLVNKLGNFSSATIKRYQADLAKKVAP